MTEDVSPVMDYAFKSLGFEELIFANAVGNDRSRRIKEKTGATLIGVEPAEFVNPKYTEHELWKLTKENWSKFKS
jgi:RimJ/RimL family protein N-acetyltransferase